MKPKVSVLDYGMGNLRSVCRAIEASGASATLTTLVEGDRLLIPGVGAFAQAAERLAPQWDKLRAFLASGKPVLGICLGMQLLFEKSHEHGLTNGLAHFVGEVVRLPKTVIVPNMGWHGLRGLGNPYVYFATAYECAK
jgi:imidazole glycerol-phosphate synthase subunit HisH